MGKVCAIVLAGGRGTRMGSCLSKQFIKVNDKPLLYYTLKTFTQCNFIDEIILVLPKSEIEFCKSEVLDKFSITVSKIVEGGSERQDSVYNGLKVLENCDIVLIHDGARPFVSKRIIEDGVHFARKYGAAAPGVTPKDTIKIKGEAGFSQNTPDRRTLCAVQTPQCFRYETIIRCHENISKEGITVTDDTMAIEIFGEKVYLYEGEYTNLKVTTPEDLILAEKLSKEYCIK
ncbi:2-C-methyl-D-erythritol 4-phosphate cytidylyltransferase [Clostridium polyendosporum]|uniref:2-C-methyl-D-erythritol 4-phosphate cytidylyltransferase n=1 Tax=Clostridium polyendosporum TaxID=69208 RepID=A0A919S0V5_9CLOT|nr:2-C-methyl-D-erythritol 4-phosphate cytidylyltransferase [Clostridium polyendosporum]GIM30057.1 2-C-methyl-D-erythritol 4-phosphate cytidylyltransferase [Clostridium polyendosporum]